MQHLPVSEDSQSSMFYSPPRKSPYRRTLRWTANSIGAGLILLLIVSNVVYCALAAAFSLIGDGMLPATRSLVYESIDLASYLLAFWLATLLTATCIGIPERAAFPLRRPRLSLCLPAVGVALGASLLGSLLAGLVSLLVSLLTGGETPYMPDASIPVGTAANVVYILHMTAAPAVFEELLFRGVILQSLRRFGDGFALVTSSLLFSLLHGNLVQIPNTLLLGLLIGYFVLRTGSLWTGMFLHFINNGLALVLTYMENWMTGGQLQILNLGVWVVYGICGMVGLLYLSRHCRGLFRLIPSSDRVSSGTKYWTMFTAVAVAVFVIVQICRVVMYIG